MYGQYFVLFAIMFTGWFLRRIDFIDDKMDHSMNKLIVYFAYPCLIVHNIGNLQMTSRIITDFLTAFGLSWPFFTYMRFCAIYMLRRGSSRKMRPA